ncbi:MAG: NPCBM/NEW2 domain-containing protein [Phycisphaerae bacterium]
MVQRLSWCLGILAMILTTGSLRADWSLTTADFATTKRITINQWSLKEGLSYTTEDSKLATLPTRQLAQVTLDTPPATGEAKWQLTLRSGDVLRGEPLTIITQGAGSLTFKTSELPLLEIPLKNIASLAATDAKATNANTLSDKDELRFRTGDTLQGMLVGLDDGKISMQSDLGSTEVKLENVDLLTFGGATPARSIPTLSARLSFVSGSTLTTRNFSWTLGKITFTDPAGQERNCTADQLVSIRVLGGRIVWLTELDVAKEEQTSLFGTRWPLQVNRNVIGGPLLLAGTRFDRGLGVHTRSVLTYNLDGSFTNFTLRCGLDDSAAPHGQANLSIALDGKVLWEAKAMKAGQISPALNLPITDGRTLELRAAPADKLDVLGRVNWVDVVLVRP